MSGVSGASDRLAAPDEPVVIYAEYRPRLSDPELLAKYGAAAPARPLARPERPGRRPPPIIPAGLPRVAWLLPLTLGAISAVTQAAGLSLL